MGARGLEGRNDRKQSGGGCGEYTFPELST